MVYSTRAPVPPRASRPSAALRAPAVTAGGPTRPTGLGGLPAGRLAARLAGCLEEARPSVQVIFLLRFAAGAALTVRTIGAAGPGHPGPGHPDPGRPALAAAAWMSAIFFVYLINGVMDVREDRVNGSRRPIARGALSRATAARVAVAAAVLSLGAAWPLGPPMVGAVLAALLIGWQYSGPPLCLKRHPIGTAVGVTLLGLLTYFAGYLAGFVPHAGARWADPGTALPIFAVTMSLWMGLVGAPSKDLSDVAGDTTAGRRTLAAGAGQAAGRRAVAIGALTIAAAFAVAAPPELRWSCAAVLAGAVTVAVVSLSRISHGDRARRRRPYRVFMVTQYAAHAALGLDLALSVSS